MANKGKRYENGLVTELCEATDDTVRVYPSGYSGNHAAPSGDIVITHQFYDMPQVAVIEAKRWKCEQGELRYIDHEDMLQLASCVNDYTSAYIAASFDHRELVFFEVFPAVPSAIEHEYGFITPRNAEVHQLDNGKLRIRKPSLEMCRSAAAGYDDATVILGELTQLELESFPKGTALTVA